MLIAGALSGCAKTPAPRWEPDAGTLSHAAVDEMARKADLSGVSGLSAEDAVAARTDVLVWLRRQGPDGDVAATLLTRGFPESTRAVPVLVAFGSIEGTRCLIAVEAARDRDDRLGSRRLWVFDAQTGSVIRSATF